MKNIKEQFREIATKEAREMVYECDGSYVGAESNLNVIVNDVEYNLRVIAFWESSNHFDYVAIDNKGNKIGEACISF